MRKASTPKDVGMRANTPLAVALKELVIDTGALAKYLDCSVQAINQYKQGTSIPQLDKLVKIADFYNVSLDYLTGRSAAKAPDTSIQGVISATGLSESALSALKSALEKNNATVNEVLQSPHFQTLIDSIWEGAQYASHRGALIEAHIKQELAGQKATFPAKDMDGLFKFETTDAAGKLYEEVSEYLYERCVDNG